MAGPIDVTQLANAKTEAEVDAAAARLNAEINGPAAGGGQYSGGQPPAVYSTIGPNPGGQNDPDSTPPMLRRVTVIDELRGLCVLAMVGYHWLYVLGSQFGYAWGMSLYEFLGPAQPLGAGMFILIAGISTRFSRNVRKRGYLLTVIALAITGVTVLLLPYLGIGEMRVWFGIIHLLAASTLLFSFCRRVFDAIPSFVGLVLCLALFFLFAPVGQGYLGMFGFHWNMPEALYRSNALAFLGFHTPEFQAFDHYPLLPYFFIFLFGTFMGGIIRPSSKIWVNVRWRRRETSGWYDEGLPEFCYRPHSAFFNFLGRRALWIYLLHIPVFYGLVYVVRAVVSMGS
ncbi:MAG: DUF1624 domain-containing protein [Oscillospiraceae bacterium]|nr:DUF1624 domain-containing protein [Oscillospiraceae bacterium]